jgi:NADPH-dependent glutamate synthase beta subunit-like oxidoreductase
MLPSGDADQRRSAFRAPWRIPEQPPQHDDRLARLADEFLNRCRGEGPANCVARCPLNVDAHGYVQLTRLGRFREALQLIREELPFPGILGYLCVHPCELHCKRIDTDTAVRIRDLKRFLAEWEPGEPQHVVECEPERDQKVAVVGGGPAGLMAAYDLRRRGWAVTLFEREGRLGGALASRIPEWKLPARVRDRDLSVIEAVGVEVVTGTEVGRDLELTNVCDGHHAVLLLVGFAGVQRLVGREILNAGPPDRGTIPVDPLSGETAIAGVFAAGDAVTGPSSVVHAMAGGRRVAETAHRFLVGDDLRRGREGHRPTRLLWQLEVDETERQRRERAPEMLQPPPRPLTEEEATDEAARCLDCVCDLCTSECDFLAKHCDVPRQLAAKIRDGPDRHLDVVYSCALCGLCKEVCPIDLDTGELMLEARRRAVRSRLAPLRRHRRELRFFRFGVSATFCLGMAEPGRRRSQRLFFTGCSLPATAPGLTIRLYHELRRRFPGTGVLMHCCGSPAEAMGLVDEARAARMAVAAAMERLGADELIVTCPGCRETLGSRDPGIEVRSVWELLAADAESVAARVGRPLVTVHDPCTARHDAAARAAVRKLIAATGAELVEAESSGPTTRCCGLGAGVADVDPQLARGMARRRADELSGQVVTYCSRCRMALGRGGAEAAHLAEFLLSREWPQDARRIARSSLRRYLNRLWVKRSLRRLAATDAVEWR